MSVSGRARASLAFVERHAGLVVFAVALIVRLIQNLGFHPPLHEDFSDMQGYLARAREMLDRPWAPSPRMTFFPYGTHVFVYAIMRVFGRDDAPAIGSAFALVGALAVSFTHATAKYVFPDRARPALVVGAIAAFYPPWIKQGGFVLSEMPLAVAIGVSSWAALRFVDGARARWAFTLGIAMALGATFRPQILLSLPFLIPLLFVRKPRTPRLAGVAAMIVPIAIVLAGSAYRTHYHTGRYGFIATNGPFNLAFGRCHATVLTTTSTSGSSFTPPSFNALENYEADFGVPPLLPLDPAFGRRIVIDGKLWDAQPALDLAKACVEKTGPFRQVKYSLSHLMLLWLYNGPWPASTGVVTVASAIVHAVVLAPAMVLGFVIAARRRYTPILVLSAHLLGLFATAIVFFGEARLRLPYDGIIVTMAVYAYDVAIPGIRGYRQRRRARKAAKPTDAPADRGGDSELAAETKRFSAPA